MGLQLLPALEDAGYDEMNRRAKATTFQPPLLPACLSCPVLTPLVCDANIHSARLDHRLTEACCSAILPCQPGDDDDKEANELVQALAAASRSQPRRRLLVEAGAQTSLFLLLPLLLTAAASQQKDEQHESRVVKVVRADKGVATDEPAAAEEAATMTDPPVLAPTAMVGTQTTAKMVEAGPDAATDAMLLQKPIGPPPSARPRLFHTGSGLSHGDSAPVLAEGGSSGSPLVLVGSGGAAFSSFFPSGFASLQPPGLSLPSPPLAGLSGSLARTPSGGEEAAAVLGATTQQQKEEEEEETGVNDEAIALEEEEEAGERVAVDGGDWAARTTLSLAHALQRQRVLQEECAAMGAERARLARQLEQVEGTNFLLGVEKERLADEVAHARAELARVEGLVEKGKEVMRDLEEEVCLYVCACLCVCVCIRLRGRIGVSYVAVYFAFPLNHHSPLGAQPGGGAAGGGEARGGQGGGLPRGLDQGAAVAQGAACLGVCHVGHRVG